MMDSHYQVQGDMVMTTITFVPTDQDKEVTCEASNEALSEPIRKTVVIEVNSESTYKTSSATMDYEKEWEIDDASDDNYSDDYPYTDHELFVNKRKHSDLNISELSDNQEDLDAVNDKLEFHITRMPEDLEFSGTKHKSENTERNIPKVVHFTENELAKFGEIDTFKNAGDSTRDKSETPTDTVFHPHGKDLSHSHYTRANIEVTEGTENKSDDGEEEQNNVYHTLSKSIQHKFSYINLLISVVLGAVSTR